MSAKYLTPLEAARLLGVSVDTLARWRNRDRKGPPYVKLAYSMVRFDEVKLLEWIRAREVTPRGTPKVVPIRGAR